MILKTLLELFNIAKSLGDNIKMTDLYEACNMNKNTFETRVRNGHFTIHNIECVLEYLGYKDSITLNCFDSVDVNSYTVKDSMLEQNAIIITLKKKGVNIKCQIKLKK